MSSSLYDKLYLLLTILKNKLLIKDKTEAKRIMKKMINLMRRMDKIC